MAGAAGPDKTWCGFLLISFHHSRGFAASGNQSLSFVGRFMTARCIFVVLARLAVCPPDLRFVSTQPTARSLVVRPTKWSVRCMGRSQVPGCLLGTESRYRR